MPSIKELHRFSINISKCLECGCEMRHKLHETAPLYCLACEYREVRKTVERKQRIDIEYQLPGRRQKTQEKVKRKYASNKILD